MIDLLRAARALLRHRGYAWPAQLLLSWRWRRRMSRPDPDPLDLAPLGQT